MNLILSVVKKGHKRGSNVEANESKISLQVNKKTGDQKIVLCSEVSRIGEETTLYWLIIEILLSFEILTEILSMTVKSSKS